MRWGVRKLPVVDLATTPGAVVESSPKGKSNVALPPPLPRCRFALAALLLPVYKRKKKDVKPPVKRYLTLVQ